MDKRIKQIIDYYGHTVNSFEQKILVSRGTIGRVLAGKITLKYETIRKICETFRNISSDWLLLGEGEMLRKNEKNEDKIPNNCQNIGQNFGNATYLSEPYQKYKVSHNSTIEALHSAIRAQQDTIEAQKALIAELRRRIEELQQ